MSAAAEAAKRKTVQDAIDQVLLKINEVEAIIGDFDGNNELLRTKLNEYIEGLGRLDAVKEDMIGGGQPVELAVELLRAVDEGTNPDTFTLQLFKDSLSQNQISKGKVEAFRALQQHMASQLEQAFPSQVADYRQLRGQPAAAAAAAAGAPAVAAAVQPAGAGPPAGTQAAS